MYCCAPPVLQFAMRDSVAVGRPGLSQDGEDFFGPHLTALLLEVLNLISRGLSNRGIAGELGLAEGTVKIHVAAIFKALGVSNRTQAVLAGSRAGFVSRMPWRVSETKGRPIVSIRSLSFDTEGITRRVVNRA